MYMCLKLLKCQVFCTSVFVIKLLDFLCFLKKSICLLDVCLIKNFSMSKPIQVIASWVIRQIMIVSTEKSSLLAYTNSNLLHCLAIFATNYLLTVKILTWTTADF